MPSSAPSANPGNWSRDVAICLGLVALALGVRLLPIEQLRRPDGGLWLFLDDPPYQLRRVLLALETWPAVSSFDAAVNFPQGARILWPPGLPWLVAGFARLVGAVPGTAAARQTIEQLATFLPAVVGALTVCLLFVVARRSLGRPLAVIAALLLVVSPSQMQYTTVGRFDHHAFEPLLLLALFHALCGALGAARGRRVAWIVWGAAVIGLALLFWPGVLLHLGVVVVAVWLAPLAASWARTGLAAERLRELPGVAAWIFAGGALAGLPAILASPWRGELVFFAPSLLHVLCLLAAASVLAVCARPRWLPLSRLSTPVLSVAAPLVVAAVCLLVPPLRAGLFGGLAYIAASPFSQLAQESKGVLARPGVLLATLGWLPLGCTVALVTVFLTRGALGAWSRAAFERASSEQVLLCCGVITLLLPALVALRWALAFSPFAALAPALCWVLIVQPIGARILTGKSRRWALLVGVALLLLSVPSALGALSVTVVDGGDKAVQRFLSRVRRLTPPALAEKTAATRPRYGVLGAWEIGHAITYIAGRPTLANNFFGTPDYDRANRQAFSLQIEEDCGRAARRMQALGLRYVLVTPATARTLSVLAGIAGGRPARYADARGRLRPAAFRTLWLRLGLADGRSVPLPDGGVLPACGHFRLVVEGHLRRPKRRDTPGELKLFELVRGAELVIRAAPRTPVTAAVSLLTERGRRLRWLSRAAVPATGTLSLRLPYSTDGSCWDAANACAVRSNKAYQVQVGERGPVRFLKVSAAAVREGKRLHLRP